MAQVFTPDNPRERVQLQGASTKKEIAYIPGRPQARHDVLEALIS